MTKKNANMGQRLTGSEILGLKQITTLTTLNVWCSCYKCMSTSPFGNCNTGAYYTCVVTEYFLSIAQCPALGSTLNSSSNKALKRFSSSLNVINTWLFVCAK